MDGCTFSFLESASNFSILPFTEGMLSLTGSLFTCFDWPSKYGNNLYTIKGYYFHIKTSSLVMTQFAQKVVQTFEQNVKRIESLRYLNAFITENIHSAREQCKDSSRRHQKG